MSYYSGAEIIHCLHHYTRHCVQTNNILKLHIQGLKSTDRKVIMKTGCSTQD